MHTMTDTMTDIHTDDVDSRTKMLRNGATGDGQVDDLDDLYMLGLNRVRTKDVKSCVYCYYLRCATLIVRVGRNTLAPNRRNSVLCTVRTFRQRSCNQRVGCLQ